MARHRSMRLVTPMESNKKHRKVTKHVSEQEEKQAIKSTTNQLICKKNRGGFNGKRTKRPRGAPGYHRAQNFAAFNFEVKTSLGAPDTFFA